jgi:1,4-alpha-glucan branching enzyme
MSKRRVISLVLNAHTPFIRHSETAPPGEEEWFFESLSETYLPLLEMFERLDMDHVPFRLAISFSPVLCHMLTDEYLINRYLEYTNKRIEFGLRELERTSGDQRLYDLAKASYDLAIERRFFFTERCERNILKAFSYYQKKGNLEVLTTAATYAFLPFYLPYPEAIQAQIEVALASHRGYFGGHPQGFWLPELGWTPRLDRYLRIYNFGYTIVDTHALVLADPSASRGSFYPVRTSAGVFALARDHYAYLDIADKERGFSHDAVYRDNHLDVGYELPKELVRPFLGLNGSRAPTGYKYWALGNPEEDERVVYDPRKAAARAREQAVLFLDRRLSRLKAAEDYMDETPLSLCAYNADCFGRFWHEGTLFIEALFREAARRNGSIENLRTLSEIDINGQCCDNAVQMLTPAEYIYKQDVSSFEFSTPGFSSSGFNGYAETWLDASTDWMYRHMMRSIERMTELSDRFPNETGLRERILNQAAREILLAQSADWTRLLYRQESMEYARNQIEFALRNFTTFYEVLGSNYISTRWLTRLERQHNIFPGINYRVFRKKR